jgi:hypothetical protein
VRVMLSAMKFLRRPVYSHYSSRHLTGATDIIITVRVICLSARLKELKTFAGRGGGRTKILKFTWKGLYKLHGKCL